MSRKLIHNSQITFTDSGHNPIFIRKIQMFVEREPFVKWTARHHQETVPPFYNNILNTACLTNTPTFDCKLFYCCTCQQHCYKVPENGHRAEICRNKLIVKYIKYRIVLFFGADRVCNSIRNARNEQHGNTVDTVKQTCTFVIHCYCVHQFHETFIYIST